MSTLENINTGVGVATNFLQLAPAVVQLIALLQSLIPHKGYGPAKKAVILSVTPPEHQEQAGAFIDNVVAVMNTTAPGASPLAGTKITN